MKFKLGTIESNKEPFEVDLVQLIATRMLLEGNSGSGKSYAIRRLCEVTHGEVQQILIDMEGEFSSLRKKFDYLVIGKNADRTADIHTADILARRLLELKVSTIIDLSDLRLHERIQYVKLFLESLMDAPRELWHPVLVIIDEAHVFCPEGSAAESSESVISLSTQGRKRGFAAVLATQRISQLSKAALAQMNNVLIGHTWLNNDKQRCKEVLGFTTNEQTNTLRDLKPGEFYAFGPAFSAGVELVQIDRVETTHPQPGEQMPKVPEITEQMKRELTKLDDIQEVKQKELKEREDFVKEIRSLRGQLAQAKRPEAIDQSKLNEVKDQYFQKGQKAGEQSLKLEVQKLTSTLTKYQRILQDISVKSAEAAKIEIAKFEIHTAPIIRPAPITMQPQPQPQLTLDPETKDLGRCERAILKFLSMRPDRDFSKSQVGAMTLYSSKSGGFNNSLSKLKTAGLIQYGNDRIRLTSDKLNEAIEVLGSEYSTEERNSLEEWLGKLGLAPKKIYEVLLNNQEDSFTKENLGELTGYSSTSGGFNNAISNLITLGLAERDGTMIRLNRELLIV